MMSFPFSSIQPVWGYLSQSAGNSQSAVVDSAIPPRKAVESDSFEKQSKPANSTVVPMIVATAILSPILGALAGEGAWQLLASEEKQAVSVPLVAQALGKKGIPKPQEFELEKFKEESFVFSISKRFMEADIEDKNKLLQNGENLATIEKHKAFQWLVEREKRFYRSVENVEELRIIMDEFIHPSIILSGYDSFTPERLRQFQPDLPEKATLVWKYLNTQNLLDLPAFSSLKSDLHNLAMTVNGKRHEIPSLPLGKVPDFEQEVFDRIQAGLKVCKENAINNPQALITQTVETSVKAGVQSFQGFGNWMFKSTEALQKTGGEALEKHAITSRWIAGSVAAVTLLVGSGVAYTISKFKPEKPVTSNTR